MAGKKSKPHHKEKIKEYYRETFELNKLRSQEKEKKRQEYFKRRNERLAVEIPAAVDDFMTNAMVNSYIGRLNKDSYTDLIHELAVKISDEKELPKGRIKQYLRSKLPKP